MLVTQSAPEWQISEWLNSPQPLSLAALRGRVVALHAFQMLCPGCVAHALPQVQRVRAVFAAQDVAVLGLHCVFEHHAAMTPVALRAFAHEYRLDYPIGIDQADETGPLPVTMSQWGLRGTPSVVLLDRQGRARLHRFGVVDDLVLGAAIGQLLAESPAVAASVLPDRVGTGKARPACDGEGCVSQ